MKTCYLLAVLANLTLGFPAIGQTPDHSQHQHAKELPDASAAEPAAAQKSDPGTKKGEGACTPEHAAMGHCKPETTKSPKAKPQPKLQTKPADPGCTPEHAAMGHCKPQATESHPAKPEPQTKPADPGCTPEHAAMGHCTPKEPVNSSGERNEGGKSRPSKEAPASHGANCTPEHAAMGHCTPQKAEKSADKPGATGTDLPAGNAPAPEVSEANYADRIWGKEAMAPVRAEMHREHGGMLASQFLLDLAATRNRDGEDGYLWDGEAWFGSDLNRFVLKAEGEGEFSEEAESTEVQALYSRAIGPYFDIQAGLRHNSMPRPTRTYASIGIEGLAPYWIDVEGTLFLSEKGDLLGRIEGRYEQLLTQRLALYSLAEINLSAQNVPDEGIPSGLVDAELGLHLAYEIRREIAPYIGIAWERKFSDAAQLENAHVEEKEDFRYLAGLRVWM